MIERWREGCFREERGKGEVERKRVGREEEGGDRGKERGKRA